MIDLNDMAETAIDDAFRAGLAHLFEVMRTSSLSNPREGAIQKFAAGYDALLVSYQDARAVIDSKRPT